MNSDLGKVTSSKVLITRPREFCDALARQVVALGFEPIINPLLEVVSNSTPLPDKPFEAVFLTSISAVRAYATRSPCRGTPILTVGEATCQSAIDAGFKTTTCLGETVSEAALAMRQRYPLHPVNILFASGEHVIGDLEALIDLPNITITRVPLYDTRYLQLEKTTIDLLYHGQIALILLFSRRTAEALMASVMQLENSECMANTCLACLSTQVAEPVSVLKWRQITVAVRPTSTALLDCLNGGRLD